uniref:Peptidase M24 domain-containing protein n=1 Tax=Rhodnius prolixus TaxID=13249 RepID=T1HWF9_RHOPR
MGASHSGYASDITISFPVTGKFTSNQKIVYEAVLCARNAVINSAKPGVSWVDMHVLANKVMLQKLTEAGLLVGEVDAMIEAGLSGILQPHGLGHLLGIDVHDVGGYLPNTPPRPKQSYLKNLRTARILEEGIVLTVEPGCYFINALLDKAFADQNLSKFLNKSKIDEFRGFGGVRIEDVVVITNTGCAVLSPLPRSQNQNEDYQYLQKSSVPTLHFQKSLPRLPIPELEDSCKRYICAQQPLVDDTEMTQIVKNVNKMLKSDGPPLQKELKAIDAANRHTSYISRPWFDMYLTDRKPLPINYNPFLVFIDDPKPEYNHQLIRSANMVISSLRFMKSLRANLLEPEVFHLNPNKSNTKFFRTVTGMLPPAISWYGAYLFKAFPLDMSQYENLFNTSRIPKTGKDTLFHDNTTRHIIVMRGGHFFKVDVLDESGNILNAQDIYTGLDYILKEPYKAPEFPLGVLTVEERNTWATARSHLENTGNAEVLKVIDSAIFCLILDESQPTRDYKELIRQYLHSDGTNRFVMGVFKN